MDESQQDLSSVKTHLFHHKIALYGVLALLVVVSIGLIIVLQSQNRLTSKAPITTTTSASSIAPQNQYENPFDKDSQYVNPFSDYKNPFDSLK